MLIQFNMPTNLNGEELVSELAATNINVTGRPQVDENKDLWLDINESDKAKAASVVAAHDGTTIAPDNSAAKAALLAKLGITADEFNILLGSN